MARRDPPPINWAVFNALTELMMYRIDSGLCVHCGRTRPEDEPVVCAREKFVTGPGGSEWMEPDESCPAEAVPSSRWDFSKITLKDLDDDPKVMYRLIPWYHDHTARCSFCDRVIGSMSLGGRGVPTWPMNIQYCNDCKGRRPETESEVHQMSML